MSLEEGQQASSVVKKRSFHAAFGPTQAIIDSLLPSVSTLIQKAASFWQHYSATLSTYVNDRLDAWQDEEEVSRPAPTKTKRRKHKPHETDAQRQVRRAARKAAQEQSALASRQYGDPDSPSVRSSALQNTKLDGHGQHTHDPHPEQTTHTIFDLQQLHLSPPAHRAPKKSLRQQYAELEAARSRASLTGPAFDHASASPMYRGMFAATMAAKKTNRSAVGLRTPRDAANVINRMTPFKPRIMKRSSSKQNGSNLPFTAANLSQYLESPSQASPDVLYRSPGAPLASPVAAFNPFKTKDKNNIIKVKTEEQSLEDLIAELRREHPHQYEWQKIDKEREARNIEIAKRRGLYQAPRVPLPVETAKKVEKAFHGHLPYDQILVDKFNQEIKVKDLKTLSPTAWLNDEVINFYMNLISERSKTSNTKLHAFNTFFYTKLERSGYKDVRRWAKKAKVDIAKCDLVLVPVHLGVHWCMSVINIQKQRFEYWDSLQGGAGRAFDALREYMDNEAPSIDTRDWEDYVPPAGPRQRNGYDCGVFACQTAEAVSRNVEPQFSQDDMPDLRKRMAASILDAKIY